MLRNRIYVAGPMSGYFKYNYPAFDAEKLRLESLDFEVESPADMGLEDASYSWEDCIKAAIAKMMTCQGVSLLEGWEKSRGAVIEKQLADSIRMDVYLPGELKEKFLRKMA